MTGFAKWLEFNYRDAKGRFRFQVYRRPDPDDPRGKRYGYREPVAIDHTTNRPVWKEPWGKPEVADELLFWLPEVLSSPKANCWMTEGERDCLELVKRGFTATSHHGGAGKFTEAQADSIAGRFRHYMLVADNDPAGARDVVRRFDLLRDAGVRPTQLLPTLVSPTHRGADLRDHFEAGFTVKDLRRGDIAQLRELAETCTDTYSDGSLSEEEVESIKNWKPISINKGTS